MARRPTATAAVLGPKLVDRVEQSALQRLSRADHLAARLGPVQPRERTRGQCTRLVEVDESVVHLGPEVGLARIGTDGVVRISVGIDHPGNHGSYSWGVADVPASS
jgi:hypothetical protein